MRLVPPALAVGIALQFSGERAWPQAPPSLAPVATAVAPVFPSWSPRALSDLHGARTSGSELARDAGAAAARGNGSPAVGLPQLHWSDVALAAAGLAGNVIAHELSVTRQTVPEQGLDPATINWGIDRNSIGDPSTSAGKASDVLSAIALAGAPALALATQPGVRGLGNVVRRPVVLYGESLLLAEACTQLLKRAADRPRPFTYLPASERPTGSQYDVEADDAFLSMPSGHSTTVFAAASYAATDNLLARPGAGWEEHVAVASIGGLLAGMTGEMRIKADQHFPSDVMAGGLIGTASGVAVPVLHRYVLPGGGQAPGPTSHAWLETAAGYLVGVGAGVGLASIVY